MVCVSPKARTSRRWAEPLARISQNDSDHYMDMAIKRLPSNGPTHVENWLPWLCCICSGVSRQSLIGVGSQGYLEPLHIDTAPPSAEAKGQHILLINSRSRFFISLNKDFVKPFYPNTPAKKLTPWKYQNRCGSPLRQTGFRLNTVPQPWTSNFDRL